MKFERTYLICKQCGLMVGVIDDSGITPVCCGEEMTLLKANTADASQEKHVPVLTRKGNILNVAVGSVPHPMTKEHHIV
ncbi:MAG: desulfoferrodoxin, partial [Clostridiales bacterium]|nr:desulfoferrodoxin [Clostridiales bacterium]